MFLAAMTVTTGTRRPLLVIGAGLAVDEKDQQKKRKYEYRGRQYKNYISHCIPPEASSGIIFNTRTFKTNYLNYLSDPNIGVELAYYNVRG